MGELDVVARLENNEKYSSCRMDFVRDGIIENIYKYQINLN
jgi:hypothetical protein